MPEISEADLTQLTAQVQRLQEELARADASSIGVNAHSPAETNYQRSFATKAMVDRMRIDAKRSTEDTDKWMREHKIPLPENQPLRIADLVIHRLASLLLVTTAQLNGGDLEWEAKRLANQVASLQDQLRKALGQSSELAQWEAQAKRGMEKLKKLEAQPKEADLRFAEVKRAFARLYHPNSTGNSSRERTTRADVFREFWGELERIEQT